MARIEQHITIGFNPHDLDALTEAIRRGVTGTSQKVWTVDYEGAEPITIETPDRQSITLGAMSTTTTRYLFIDGDNQEHWVPSERAGRDRGWRQAFFLPGR